MIRTPITDEIDPYLRRRNSIHRVRLRQIEKNRFPKKCECVVCGEFFLCGNIEDYLKRQYYLGPKNGHIRHVCWDCDLTHKVRAAAAKLYNLVCAISTFARDQQEIYPADFRYPRVPPWRQEKMRLPGLGLRDYSEPAKLLTKFGRYDSVIRQRAASPVRSVLSNLVALPVIHMRWSLALTPAQTQQTLKRIGRLYKNSCWFPKITGVRFDQRRSAYLHPKHAPRSIGLAGVVSFSHEPAPARPQLRIINGGAAGA